MNRCPFWIPLVTWSGQAIAGLFPERFQGALSKSFQPKVTHQGLQPEQPQGEQVGLPPGQVAEELEQVRAVVEYCQI